MNIGWMTRTPLLVALFLGTTLGGLGQSYAGFQVTEQSAPQEPAPMIVSNAQMDGSSLPPVAEAKALEVFNDRYIPDSVRKKYNLDDNWFGKNAPLETPPAPLTPPPPVVSEPETLSAQPAPVLESKTAIVESWRGRKGENIRDVLQRWSERGSANLMWASPDAPVLQKDFTFVGKFQDAVNALIKAEGGDKIHSQFRSEGLNPVMMEPASTVTTNTPPAVKEAPQPEAAAPAPAVNPLAKIFQPEVKKDVRPETRWFALSGAPLAEVMRVWADDAGVQLIWQSERNFAIKESISHVGHFEDAVFKALSQYDAEEIRPVGEMYRDPKTGQPALVVRTEVK